MLLYAPLPAEPVHLFAKVRFSLAFTCFFSRLFFFSFFLFFCFVQAQALAEEQAAMLDSAAAEEEEEIEDELGEEYQLDLQALECTPEEATDTTKDNLVKV